MSIYKGTTQVAGIPTGLIDTVNGKADINASNLSTTGKSTISGLGMPSGRYIELTLGASGTTYTAPANGYFTINWWTTSTATSYIQMSAPSVGVLLVPNQGSAYQIRAFLPVKKGQIMTLAYGNLEATSGSHSKFLRFVYAEGEE